MTARETILRAWWASRRQSDVIGHVNLDAVAFAGYALEAADGDVEKALILIPREIETFWSRCRSHLELVGIEESKTGRRVTGETAVTLRLCR